MLKYVVIALVMLSTAVASADQVLCDELANDPLGRGYSGMTPAEQFTDLTTPYRTQWRGCVEGTELLDAIAAPDWVNITDAERDRVLLILAIGCMNPQKNVRTLLIGIFGSGSQTISNMASVAQEPITRAGELDILDARPGRIQECP